MIATLDIQESLRLAPYGILAFTDKTYFKPRKLTDAEKKECATGAEYELIPLTTEERAKYGIIEESEHQNGPEIEIEESEQGEGETEEEKLKRELEEQKRKNLTLTGSPEVVASAKEILQREMNKKNDNDLAEKKLQAIEKFGRADLWTQATSTEMLSGMLTNFINDIANKGKGTPSGSAPANELQYGQKPDDLYTHKFSSYDELIATLREKARSGNREAQSYLDSLTEDAYRKMRTTDSPIPIPNSRNDVENLPALKDFHGYKVPIRKEEGDLGALVERWANENPRRKRAKEQTERER